MTGDLDSLYRIRFDKEQLRRKAAIWRVLCRDFFQRFVDPTDTVLDLGMWYGGIHQQHSGRKAARCRPTGRIADFP